MAFTDNSGMPFGYDFGEVFGQQDPQPQPAGPPLLSDTENNLLGNFWSNPDNPSFMADGNQLYPFTFGMEEQDGTTTFNPEFMGPTYAQNINGQVFHPIPDQTTSTQQPTTNSDEGNVIAQALMSMSYDGPGLHRNRGTPTQTVNQFAPSVLNAAQYSSDHSARHTPLHAPSMQSYHRASAAHPWAQPSRPAVIPSGLPFDTDQAFTTAGSGPVFNSRAPTDGFQSPLDPLQNHAFMPLIDHGSGFIHNRVQNGQPPPSLVHRASAGSSSELTRGGQVARRLTNDPPHRGSPPTKIEPQSETFADSPGSSNSGGTAGSPSAQPRSALKRRQKGTNEPTKTTPGGKRQKLTTEQRKINHIQSEKRRRGEMQRGYAQLDKLVPSLKSVGLSKAQVLQHTVIFLDALVKGNSKAAKEIARRQKENGNGGQPTAGSG